MNLTERATLILDIAHRILREHREGRKVDPSRLEWAQAIVSFNPPVNRPVPTEAQDMSGRTYGDCRQAEYARTSGGRP